MDETTKKRLEELLEKHDERHAELEQKRAEAAEAAEKVKTEAGRYVVENIKPVLDGIAEVLVQKGHHAWVSEEGSSCRIDVMPSTAKGAGTDRPYLRFRVGRDEVGMDGSNILPGRGGKSGSLGSVPRAEFSAEIVSEKTLEWLGEIL